MPLRSGSGDVCYEFLGRLAASIAQSLMKYVPQNDSVAWYTVMFCHSLVTLIAGRKHRTPNSSEKTKREATKRKLSETMGRCYQGANGKKL